MPPTVSYLSIDATSAIPIRVFLDRKKIASSSSVAVNQKSIIKLSSVNSIRLSNYDMNNLTSDIQAQLRRLLFETPLAELFPGRSVSKNTAAVTEISSNWKCKVVVSLGYIADLRFKLSSLGTADVVFLREKNIAVEPADLNKSSLMKKELKFNLPSFSEDADSGPIDDKKILRYKLHRQHLLNNRVTDSLNIYVMHRPRH